MGSVEKSTIAIKSVEKSITINSVEKATINSLVRNTFNRMSVIKISFIVLISVYISLAARAPDASDPVNFNVFPSQQFPVLSGINTAPTEPRDGRQSVLGCLKGCTRELRPVRGIGLPDVLLVIVVFGGHDDLVSHEEGRIESNTKLSNKIIELVSAAGIL